MPVQQEEVCSWLVVFSPILPTFLLRRFFLLASFLLSVVSLIFSVHFVPRVLFVFSR